MGIIVVDDPWNDTEIQKATAEVAERYRRVFERRFKDVPYPGVIIRARVHEEGLRPATRE